MASESERTWVELDGELFGARPDDAGPIGGGAGYGAIVEDGDICVSTLTELMEAFVRARPGQIVFVAPEAEIDMTVRARTERLVLAIPAGVTLASDRGKGDSPGGLIYSDEFATDPLFVVKEPGVRVTGLRLRGPDPKRREDLEAMAFGPGGLGHDYYYKFPVSTGLQVDAERFEADNCDCSGWSHAAIYLRRGVGHRVHHSSLHHNQRGALGYGVCLDLAEALIDHNRFDSNRHSIAATGRPGSGYEAAHNLVLGNANGHPFDMHGGWDRQDGTNVAGTWMNVHHNTFRVTTVPGVKIRGVPEREALIRSNWFYVTSPGRESVVSGGHTRMEDNVFGVPPRRAQVETTVAVLSAPSFVAGGRPGRLRVRLTNRGDEPVRAVLAADVAPAGAAMLAAADGLAFELPPHQSQVREVEVRLAQPQTAPGALKLVPHCCYGSIMAPASPFDLELPVEGLHPLIVVEGHATWEGIEALLAPLPSFALTLGPGCAASLRFAILGEQMVIEARVDDAAPRRIEPIWRGSCVECFGVDAVSGAIGQVLLAPSLDGQAAAGFCVAAGGSPVSAPAIKVHPLPSPAGYALRALIPLALLNLESRADEVRLESQVSWCSSAAAGRQYRTLFGTVRAYENPQFFGRFAIERRR